ARARREPAPKHPPEAAPDRRGSGRAPTRRGDSGGRRLGTARPVGHNCGDPPFHNRPTSKVRPGGGPMSRLTRRSFLNRSLAAAGAGFAIGGTKSSGRVLGANDAIRIGIAGLNGRGGSHVDEFSRMDGVQITYLIDPDTRTYEKRLEQI